VFTNEARTPDPARTPTEPGCVHHLALAVSQATFAQTVDRLDQRGIRHSGVKDRGFMDSIYFTDPLGLLIELASYRFEPPAGHTHADVLFAAHRLRVTIVGVLELAQVGDQVAGGQVEDLLQAGEGQRVPVGERGQRHDDRQTGGRVDHRIEHTEIHNAP
jgi:hypothetical protein